MSCDVQELTRPLPRRRRNPAATRASILAAACELMAQQGPETLSVSEVAFRAGVNRTTAYQHFRTRDELIDAVLAELGRQVRDVLTKDLPMGERIDHMVEFYLERPEIPRLWMYQLLGGLPLREDESWNTFVEMMRAFAASDVAEDEIDPEMLSHILVAVTLIGSLHAHTAAHSKASRREITRRFVRELKRLLLSGAVKAERPPAPAAQRTTSRRNDDAT
jgi:AcrR family transcriptional regulator